MRRFALKAALAGLLLAPIPALAQGAGGLSGFYVGAFAGAGFIGEQDVDTDVVSLGLALEADSNLDYDTGVRYGGYVGYQLDTNIRVQVDVSYMGVDAKNTLEVLDQEVESDQETTILSGTAGIFLDLWPVGSFVPYVGGGAGIAQIETENNDLAAIDDTKQTVLTAYAEAGLPFNITPNLAVVPAGRFSWYDTKEKNQNVIVGATDFEFAAVGEGLYEYQLLLSARYSF